MNTKTFSLVSLCVVVIVSSLLFIGCGNTKKPKNYSTELKTLLPQKETDVFYSEGTYDYAHRLSINKIVDASNYYIVDMDGAMKHIGSKKDTEIDNFKFSDQFIVNKDFIEEKIKYNRNSASNSIMLDRIALKEPIKEGTTWEETFNDGKNKYVAKSSITKVEKTKENKSRITTYTKIENIPNFPNNTYEETRVFEEGKGIVECKKSIPLIKNGEKLENMYFDFSYKLTKVSNK